MSKRRRILQARERERQAWSLTQRGRTQGEIATELGITQPSVSKILARLEQRVLGELAGSVQELELRQAARLEYLYREAVDAWESSKPISAVDGSAAAERRAPGDRRFLAEARTVLADLRRLWDWMRRLRSRRRQPTGRCSWRCRTRNCMGNSPRTPWLAPPFSQQ